MKIISQHVHACITILSCNLIHDLPHDGLSLAATSFGPSRGSLVASRPRKAGLESQLSYRSELAEEAALVALQEEPHQLSDLHPRYAARSIDRCHACATALSPRFLSRTRAAAASMSMTSQRRHASLSKIIVYSNFRN